MPKNPYAERETISIEDCKRVAEVDSAYAELWEKLQSLCTNPSRELSLALTQLEFSHAMAVKSISQGALP